MLLNQNEYCEFVQCVKKPGPKSKPKVGRRPNATYEFHPDHPLYKTHVQQLRSQPVSVQLGGCPPPTPPGDEPDPSSEPAKFQAWKKRADAFAAYVGPLLMPWDLDGHCHALDWETFSTRVKYEWKN